MKTRRTTVSILSILIITLLAVSLIAGCSSPAPSTTQPAATTPAKTAAAPITTAPVSSVPASSTAAPASSDQKVYTMDLQLAHQRSQILVSQVLVPFAKTLEDRSNGRLKVNLFDQGSVAANPQVISAVDSNTLQGAWVLTAWAPGAYPLDDLFGLPMLFPSATVAGQTIQDVTAKFPEFAKEWPANVKVLSGHSTGLLQLITVKKQVLTMADLKGLKIFGLDPISLKYIELLGASPTTLAMVSASDFYLALQRGMGDGAFFSFAAVRSSKLQEVTKYCSIVNSSCNPFYFIINKGFYDSLPADLKKIVDEETGAKLSEAVGKVGLDQAVESDAKWVKENSSMVFAQLSSDEANKWKTTLKPMRDDLVKQLTGKGYSAQTLQSILDEIDSYSAQLVQKGAYVPNWSALTTK